MSQQNTEFDYKRYLQLLAKRQRLFIVCSLLIMTVGICIVYLMPRKYESTSTVFIEKNIINELVKGIAVSPSMDETIKVLTYAITSRTLLMRVVDNLDMNLKKRSEAEMEIFIKELQKNTVVKVKDKNLFIISYKDHNPRLARDYINTLVRLYIEENTSSKRGESYDATKFLSEQIDTFRKKMEEAESTVNRYKMDRGGVISIDEGKLFQEINTAQQKVYDLELRRRQLEGMRQSTRKAGDPLQIRLLGMQKRLEELRTQYTDNYPEIVRLKGEIDEVQGQMRQKKGDDFSPLDPQELSKIESEIAAIKISEDGLKRYIATNKNLLQSIPSAKAGLEKLELEQKNQKNIYDQLFSRHSQSEVSKQMEVQDKTTTFRIVDPAIMPIKPSSPNRQKLLPMMMLVGIGCGFGIIVLMDLFNKTLKSVDELKTLKVPILVIIPKIQDPLALQKEAKLNRRYYLLGGVYLMVVLSLVGAEVAGLSPVDRMFDPASLVESIKGLPARFR